ncbi:MAG: single-stranded-DNA-specific exonuclease RecJ [Flavobacteriales bacterium]
MTRWIVKPNPPTEQVQLLQESLNVSPVIATLLAQRGITDFDKAKQFFRPQMKHLHDPFLMKDMNLAVQRLTTAIQSNQTILVYGDYDVDGTTAVSLMYLFLKQLTKNLEYYIPDRYDEGYGVSYKAIDYAKEKGIDLIICLDCGIKAVDKIDYANSLGIDFIICDHHRPGKKLPSAVAVLDPKRHDCDYPFDELSGCGVGFKLAQAYCQQHNISSDVLTPLLDLLVISIAADIVPIVGENRTLAFFGLQQLNSNPRVGVKALIQLANRTKQLTISDVVFGLSPRINAAGRIEHGKKAVELLVEDDFQLAKSKAERIEKHNFTRRELDQNITQEALEQINPSKKSTVVFSEKWHKGVVGIVASRLIESHYKPTIVLTESNGKLTGSARSVKHFDVYNAIEACSDLLEQFGGHKYAAGLTLKKENLSAFIDKFEQVVSNTIEENMLTDEISIDLTVNWQDVTPKTYRILQQMAPFGPSNNQPILMLKAVYDKGYGRIIGQDESHLKLGLSAQSQSNTIDAIGFRMATKFPLIKDQQLLDVCFVLEENDWNGNTKLQLRLKDIRKSLL